MQCLLDCVRTEPSSSVEGGIICPQSLNVFIYNPVERIWSKDGNTQTHNVTHVGDTVMVIDYNCSEQLVVCSSAWHKVIDIESGWQHTRAFYLPGRSIREIYDVDGFVTDVSWHHSMANVFASTGTDSTIRTWDIRAHPAQTMQLRRQRRYKCIEYTPDSTMLAFGGDSLNIIELRNPRNVFQYEKWCSPITNIKFSPVEYLFATTSEDGVIRFWDIESTECVCQSLPFDNPSKHIDFDTNGRYLFAADGSVIKALSWEPYKVAGHLDVNDVLNPETKILAIRPQLDDLLHLSCNNSRTQLNTIPFKNMLNISSSKSSNSLDDLVQTDKVECFAIDFPIGESPILPSIQKTPETNTIRSRNPSISSAHAAPSRTYPPRSREPSSAAALASSQPASDPKAAVTPKRNGSIVNANAVSESHKKIINLLNGRIDECRRVAALLKAKNREGDALDESSQLKGLHIFAQLLKAYKQQPNAYSLQVCTRVLPSLRSLLCHKNSDYQDIALDTLENVLNQFGEPIKHALAANASSIGVDFAAEQRHASCTACKQSLTDIYINSSFILTRLNVSQSDFFKSLLPLIETITEL